MSIISSNQNLYYVDEDIVDDNLYIELHPVIAFDVDSEYEQKVIALNLGVVKGTLFDLNQNMFISTNGIKKTPREYIKNYSKLGLTVYISSESQEFLGLIVEEEKGPAEVTIVTPDGQNLTSSLGVETYVFGGSLD
jgi:hypothetical protein